MMELKIIKEPTVYVVGVPYANTFQLEKFLTKETKNPAWQSDSVFAAESLTETAGRVCYMSFENPRPGGNKAYMENILSSGHGSVLEHAAFNFIFTGISRSLSHELVRHRAGWAYSQLSQRYVDESDVAFIQPEAIEDATSEYQEWLAQITTALTCYRNLIAKLDEKYKDVADKTLRKKMSRQAARSVLPNCTETKIFASANLRAIRHFIELRGSIHAEPEIRKLAHHIVMHMKTWAPNIFSDYSQKYVDGTSVIEGKYRKV